MSLQSVKDTDVISDDDVCRLSTLLCVFTASVSMESYVSMQFVMLDMWIMLGNEMMLYIVVVNVGWKL